MQATSDTFNALRITLEAKLSLPAIVVVSSAQDGDGSAAVACNLACKFAESSYRTILIDTNAADPCLSAFFGKPKVEPAKDIPAVINGALNGVVSNLHMVSMASTDIGGFNSSEKMGNLSSALKEKYDVIVVQTAPVTTTPLGMQFIRCADGVLMTVKHGRKSSNADKEALEQLQRLDAKVLGVVMTGDPKAKKIPHTAVTAQPARTLTPISITTGSEKKESVGAAR